MLFSNRGASASTAHVVNGHFCGFTLLLIVTLVAFLSLRSVPLDWVGLLGFVPMILAIRHWIRRNEPPVRHRSRFWNVPVAKGGNSRNWRKVFEAHRACGRSDE